MMEAFHADIDDDNVAAVLNQLIAEFEQLSSSGS